MKKSTVRMIRALVMLAQTLKSLPNDRYLSLRLLYRDDVTPAHYEPLFFRAQRDEGQPRPFPIFCLCFVSPNAPLPPPAVPPKHNRPTPRPLPQKTLP